MFSGQIYVGEFPFAFGDCSFFFSDSQFLQE